MSEPARVLHIFGRMNRGGAETFIMRVYRHIDRSKVQFDFGVCSPEPGHYDEEIRRLGGRIFVLPRPRLVSLPTYQRALKDVLRREGPFAAVHSHVHFFSGIPLAIAESARVPVRIAHSHTLSDGKSRALPRRAYRWYMRRLILQCATHMLGCSRPACEALYGPKCWGDGRVRVVHNGIDLAPFQSLPQDRNALRAKLGFPQDAPLIGHVGSFNVQKNHRFLIEVFEAISRRLPESYLMLVGDGPLRPEIERLVAEKGLKGRVLFVGIRTDVPEVMGCFDLFLCPSLWEGGPIVLIEAQAAGVPSVASNVISSEMDLELGLVQFISLQANISQWVECIINALRISLPNWDVREQALRTHGYDAQQVASFLEGLYVGK